LDFKIIPSKDIRVPLSLLRYLRYLILWSDKFGHAISFNDKFLTKEDKCDMALSRLKVITKSTSSLP